METGETIVAVTSERARAEAWSFVLEALGVPHRLFSTERGWELAVPPGHVQQAQAAIAAHEREAAEDTAQPLAPDLGPSPVALALPAALVAFFFITGPRGGADPTGWFRAGSAVAERIVGGDFWRAVTALTLHADMGHVLGNAVALAIFLSALGRWIGGGLTFLLALAAGAIGNVLTAVSYGHGHNSVGASTAAFGAVGILGGLQFVRRFRITGRLDRRRRALAAIAACLGLFAMLGVGERSDVLAHLFGLVVGLALGLATGLLLRRPLPRAVGWALGAAAAVLVAAAWLTAFAAAPATLVS